MQEKEHNRRKTRRQLLFLLFFLGFMKAPLPVEHVSFEEIAAFDEALRLATSRSQSPKTSQLTSSKRKLEVMYGLRKIISGGQTGADRAGLEAAAALGLETGGTAPQGYMTSSGKDPALGSRFGLVEMPKRGKSYAQMYISRSKKNVDDGDATVVFRLYSSPGSDKTIGYCQTGKWVNFTENGRGQYRPVLIITSLREEDKQRNVMKLREFVRDHNVCVLNVAGHREGEIPSFSFQVKTLLVEAFG